MSNINIDLSKTGVSENELEKYMDKVEEMHNKINEKCDDLKEFMGWAKLPTNYDKDEFERIKKASEKIKKDSDVLIVIGIGGSYLGARAVIDALSKSFIKGKPEVLYAGNNISPNYLSDLIEYISNKDISINVISKSGTTTEPAISFRIFKELLEKKYGKEEAKKRIYVTTDKEKGTLKNLSNDEGYETFIIPDNVGGRYSVLTAVRTITYSCGRNRYR